MSTITKKAASPIILKVTAPAGANYKIKDLWTLAGDAATPIKLTVVKAVQNSDGSMSPIDNVSDKSVDIEVILNGAEHRNTRGTVVIFKGHTCDPAALPGDAIRVSILGDDGKPNGTKENDDKGFGEDTTFIQFIWDEGSQSGEIRRYANSAYDVKLGTMSKVFPIDDPADTKTPVPTGCRKPVKESDINA